MSRVRFMSGDDGLTNSGVRVGDMASDHISASQRAFHPDSRHAELVPPSFGRPNINIMSSSSNFEEFHGLPAWKALGEMTKPTMAASDWRIEMKS